MTDSISLPAPEFDAIFDEDSHWARWDAAATREQPGLWEILCVLAPLRVPHDTGSPVSPIAIF